VQKNEHTSVTGAQNFAFALKTKGLLHHSFWFVTCSRLGRGFELLPKVSAFSRKALFDPEVECLMNRNSQDQVDEHRAAVLLGMPESDLRRYSLVSGLGHVEDKDQDQRMVFTYEELRRICLLVAQSSK
jgi:hypothetical protein